MLKVPTSGTGVVKLIGIDPGTSFPGVCVLQYDMVLKKIVRVSAQCLHLERLSRRSIHANHQTSRYLKLLAFDHFLVDLFKSTKPWKVASEHPYLNASMPGAVIPLAECLYMTESVVHRYNPYMSLEKIDPSSIKNAVGVKGNSGNKRAMADAIKIIPELMDVLVGDIDTMDNNAVDSIAVAYCSLKRELNHDVTR